MPEISTLVTIGILACIFTSLILYAKKEGGKDMERKRQKSL